jgi:hypothetical protein
VRGDRVSTYLAILVTCDVLRVESIGLALGYGPDGAAVTRVDPGTAAHRHGVEVNDRLLTANGRRIEGQVDWLRVQGHLDPSRPLELAITRDGAPLAVPVSLSAGVGQWRTGPSRPGLVAFRLVDIIALGFALVVAYRRRSRPSALSGIVAQFSGAAFSGSDVPGQ